MGNHAFDQLCQALAIEHRLTKPRAGATSGLMVARDVTPMSDAVEQHVEPWRVHQCRGLNCSVQST